MPEANTLTIGIFATLAQHERELISSRTKAALAAKRAQGEKVGNPANFTKEGRAKGAAGTHRAAQESLANRRAAELARLYHSQGLNLTQIAARLNEGVHVTRMGRCFHPNTVSRLLAWGQAVRKPKRQSVSSPWKRMRKYLDDFRREIRELDDPDQIRNSARKFEDWIRLSASLHDRFEDELKTTRRAQLTVEAVYRAAETRIEKITRGRVRQATKHEPSRGQE